eukprot:TRINITY_DN1742_c0_g1_i1.p1 TRINITY_DN1742_c0_g1~~TRINITY_DN1742_c0_g1_i1.p1  ORF type:complete len:133 (+),score=38.37 TRINITY_DN1742_c0_g1_i1:57-455(+)
MSLMGNDVDLEAEEEKRIGRFVKACDDRAKISTEGKVPNNAWVVKLIDLPQGPGELVTATVNGQVVFTSDGTDNPVTTELYVPIEPAPSNTFTLSVKAFPWPPFTYKASEGVYLKFALSGSKFEKAQQTKPF